MNELLTRKGNTMEISLISLLFTLLALVGTSHSYQNHSTCGQQKVFVSSDLLIVGGKPAQVGEWPWQALMIRDGVGVCGATLIDPQWVMSAAHCVITIPNKPDLFNFKMGTNSYSTDPANTQVRTAKEIFMHPDYVICDTDHDSDIALFKLEEPFNLTDYVQTVCLPTTDMADKFPVGTQVTVTGWGSTENSSRSSEDLLEVSLPIVDQDDCKSTYESEDVIITENMLCAGETNGGKDSCGGDSGGPLVTQYDGKWFQVGVVSFGYGCGVAGYPGVYVRLTAFQDWIAPIFDGEDPDRQDSNCTDRGLYRCYCGGCIPYDAKCDGVKDCLSNSDEAPYSRCDFPISIFDRIDTLKPGSVYFKIPNEDVSQKEFVLNENDCAALCLASGICVAFDVRRRDLGGYECDMAGSGFKLVEEFHSSWFPGYAADHYELGKLKDPEPVMHISSHHGFIGYPVQLPDPTDMSGVYEFVWNIEPRDQVNSITFRFTGIHTDETLHPLLPCSNYLTVGDEDAMCLALYQGWDSFTVVVDSPRTSVKLNTNNVGKNGFLAEYTTGTREPGAVTTGTREPDAVTTGTREPDAVTTGIREPYGYEDLKNERNMMRAAVIGVSVVAGVAVMCLIVMAYLLFTKRGVKARDTQDPNAFPVHPIAQPATNNGQDNLALE
ncbi:uncharacterized protein LOC119722447 [Patiria miniata]|uniref:Peptidase S1 domain-containing protein n=1 Tax=Patiria miniata TaxID=46514 RepID=A0A913Z9S2_PATMI|nr:uncharacterized protein LOC119722447 [Patiria miniata]XP_038048514.1 uncharacterized protein LOC119722447 [Patiria miniata]